MNNEITKQCVRCHQDKCLEDFGNDKSRPDGKFAYCKVCVHEMRDTDEERARIRGQNKKRRESSEVKQQRVIDERARRYKRLYGITAEEYDTLLGFQDGRCAICHHLPKSRRLAVDHDHKTGEVRGLLCTRCNQTLHNRVSLEWLSEAYVYLDVPPVYKALGRTPVGKKGRIKKNKRHKKNTESLPNQQTVSDSVKVTIDSNKYGTFESKLPQTEQKSGDFLASDTVSVSVPKPRLPKSASSRNRPPKLPPPPVLPT